MASATIHAEVDESLKLKAEAIFADAGLSLSEAFRLLLLRAVEDHTVPFNPLVPNEATKEAMRAVDRGEVVRVGSIEDLMAEFHAQD